MVTLPVPNHLPRHRQEMLVAVKPRTVLQGPYLSYVTYDTAAYTILSDLDFELALHRLSIMIYNLLIVAKYILLPTHSELSSRPTSDPRIC